jgi:hypothetical protein
MHRRYRRHRHGHGHGGCGPGSRRSYPSREERLQALEEYQKDLEQEVADVAERIRRLKEQPTETATV